MSQSKVSTKEIDKRISWVLEHRTMSRWLKDALNSALDRNPIDLLNDLEILNHLLRARSSVLLRQTSGQAGGRDDDLSDGQTN
ncbi:MAG: hypothetical protein J0I08_12965 [Rhizobiales bacterium]|jgi:hypothetical protein|nr:hypothetical protein [Hyphomicrobiales bacterium]